MNEYLPFFIQSALSAMILRQLIIGRKVTSVVFLLDLLGVFNDKRFLVKRINEDNPCLRQEIFETSLLNQI